MADDAAVTPPAEPSPEPQPADPVTAVPDLAPPIATPAPAEVPVVPTEVANQISDVIADAVQEAIVPEAAARPPPSTAERVPSASTPTPDTEAAPPYAASKSKPSAGAHMREVVQKRKRERLEEIVKMAHQKKIITNADVQEVLDVSDPTATRYLEELVKAGRLKRSGVRAGTRYSLIDTPT